MVNAGRATREGVTAKAAPYCCLIATRSDETDSAMTVQLHLRRYCEQIDSCFEAQVSCGHNGPPYTPSGWAVFQNRSHSGNNSAAPSQPSGARRCGTLLS